MSKKTQKPTYEELLKRVEDAEKQLANAEKYLVAVEEQLVIAKKAEVQLAVEKIAKEKLETELQNSKEEIKNITKHMVPLKNILHLHTMKINQNNRSISEIKGNSSVYTSSHDPVVKVIPRNFKYSKTKILYNEETLKGKHSMLFDYIKLDLLHTTPEGIPVVDATGEMGIQNYCSLYVRDLINVMGLEAELTVHNNARMSDITKKFNSDGGDYNYPDITITKTKTYDPVIVYDAKKYGNDIFVNKKILGQCYDYLKILKSFYGQKKPYCILTDFNEWLIVELTENEDAREVYISRIYKHDDKYLAKAIMTVISRSLRTYHNPVKIFDRERNYIAVDSESWGWYSMNNNTINFLSDNFTLEYAKLKNKFKYVTILKNYEAGPNSQSFLAITDTGVVCVLKQVYDSSSIDNEVEMWKDIYDEDIIVEQLNNKQTMLLPFMFTGTQLINKDGDREIFFETNIDRAFTQEGAVPGELFQKLNDLQDEINGLYDDLKDIYELKNTNFYNLAVVSINEFKKTGYIHNDIKIEHFGLYPYYENGVLNQLLPTMLDLGDVSYNSENIDNNKNIMIEKLNVLTRNAVYDTKSYVDNKNSYKHTDDDYYNDYGYEEDVKY